MRNLTHCHRNHHPTATAPQKVSVIFLFLSNYYQMRSSKSNLKQTLFAAKFQRLTRYAQTLVAAELDRHIEELRTRGLHHLETAGPIRFGSDYVISASPR